MPSISAKQARFMAIASKSPKVAADAGIPQSVAREFHEAEKAKHTKIARKLMEKGE